MCVDSGPPLKTLLLAESHPPTLEHLTGLLSQAGYTVRAVSDPASAMEHFAAGNPDVVVLSVDLPRLEGGHVGQLIRAHRQGGRVPLAIIDKGHLGKARGLAAVADVKVDAYIPDPLKPGELAPRLEALVSAAKAVAPTTGIEVLFSRAAVVAGDLKGYPLPALLHVLFRQRRDGMLVVASRELSRRVFFARGGAVNFDSTSSQDGLPAFLLERKLITPAQAEPLVQALGSGLRIGAALADAGVEAAGEELLQILRDYTRDRVAQVVGMREGRFAFYAGDEFQREVATVEIPALAPALEGARRAFPLKVVAAPLRKHLGEYPTRSPDFSKDLPVLGLDTEDLKIAMQINGRLLLRDLLAYGRGDLRSGYSLVWFLQLTGALTFSPTPVVVEGEALSAFPEVLAKRKRKPLPAETAAALREGALKIITSSYFRSLGLDIAADGEGVERAYNETAMKFHPDAYAEFDLSDLEDVLDSVQERLSASYRVLSVEEKRKAYLQYLLPRLNAGRVSTIHVEAEILIRRGATALKRKDYRTALQVFEEAVDLNPREPEYHCYLAWATYLATTGPLKERAKAAQKVLKRAFSLEPQLERAHIISAIIDNDLEDDSAARKRLLRVLELNPQSQLAKAALRKVGR
ncbi:Response regulator receiver domain-containing protein [Stigmatella erecta]|uniref:Response regulator receiver domain-containing protein n=1 Tax=Stigmatella erecta TaxID=83460 RepID=A0A1I0J8C1_9BACT|nr:Response regulator receiver domain-containing protein [Stigmatella erecta]